MYRARKAKIIKVRKEEEKKVERKNKYIPPKLSALVSHVRPSKLFLVWMGDGNFLVASVAIEAEIKNIFFLHTKWPPAGVDLWAD
jgi:hypothetical protein